MCIKVGRTEEGVPFGGTTQQSPAAAAFAAAQPEWNGVSWWSSGMLQAVGNRLFDNYTPQAGAVTVIQMISQEGYQDVGGWLLAEDGVPEEELYCRTEFTMTLQTQKIQNPAGEASGVQSFAKVVRSNMKGNPDGSSLHQEPQQATVVF